MNWEELGSKGIESLVDEWIVGRNAERNRKVLKERFINGTTYERMAEIFELSVTQVKRIVYRGTEILSKHM